MSAQVKEILSVSHRRAPNRSPGLSVFVYLRCIFKFRTAECVSENFRYTHTHTLSHRSDSAICAYNIIF